MSLTPLFNAPAIIQFHVFCIFISITLGWIQLYRRKGTQSHKALGYIWVVFMVSASMSSFFIKIHGSFSYIHLLAVFNLTMITLGIGFAIKKMRVAHQNTMVYTYWLSLYPAGIMAFFPPRLMAKLLF